MNLNIKGIAISIPDCALEQLVLERFAANDHRGALVSAGTLPRIGAEFAELGGVFAGVMRGCDGAPDYYLIVGPEASSTLTWQKALDWAEGVTHLGFDYFCLPFRKEQALCFANVPELFKAEWYWSQEQYADGSVYAWGQYFGNGYQSHLLKDGYSRARAVRRVPIQ